MHVLIVGGLGYIGSQTVVAFAERGWVVSILDDLSNSRPETLGRIERLAPAGSDIGLTVGDACDAGVVEKLFGEAGPFDVVVHFAARKSVPASMANPLEYYGNNLNSLLTLLRVMVKRGERSRLLFSSSAAVYGNTEGDAIEEGRGFGKALSPYAATKQMSERILEDAVRAYPLEVLALRYFNPVGAHPSGLLGEDSPEATGSLQSAILAVAKRVSQRNNGTTEQRNNGTTEQRNNGTTEQRNNGTTEQRNNGTTRIRDCRYGVETTIRPMGRRCVTTSRCATSRGHTC